MVELYQSYTDTRIAIEKKFNEDIATLRKQREESIKKEIILQQKPYHVV